MRLDSIYMRCALLAGAMCLSAQDTVIRTTVPLILVLTTVTDYHGKTIEGLTESDFEVLDNGRPVKHSLEITNQPVALVVAVQTSAISGPALAKVQKIGSMFEPLVVGEGGVAAILTYSDQVKVWQDFTHSADDFKFRRVLVVIGESRDRGSKAKLEEAVTKAQAANVTIYPVNYSVYKTSYTSPGVERFEGSGQRVYNTDPGNLLLIFSEIGRLGTQNAGDALAKYTGGEKVSFTRLAGLEKVIAKVGEDLHTQYLLSFQASASENKIYHAIKVNVTRAQAVVRARPGYWSE